jgi:hypothetical protein
VRNPVSIFLLASFLAQVDDATTHEIERNITESYACCNRHYKELKQPAYKTIYRRFICHSNGSTSFTQFRVRHTHVKSLEMSNLAISSISLATLRALSEWNERSFTFVECNEPSNHCTACDSIAFNFSNRLRARWLLFLFRIFIPVRLFEF